MNALKPLRPVATEGFRFQRPDADFSTWATPEDMAKQRSTSPPRTPAALRGP